MFLQLRVETYRYAKSVSKIEVRPLNAKEVYRVIREQYVRDKYNLLINKGCVFSENLLLRIILIFYQFTTNWRTRKIHTHTRKNVVYSQTFFKNNHIRAFKQYKTQLFKLRPLKQTADPLLIHFEYFQNISNRISNILMFV